jgi:hypothetical protein
MALSKTLCKGCSVDFKYSWVLADHQGKFKGLDGPTMRIKNPRCIKQLQKMNGGLASERKSNDRTGYNQQIANRRVLKRPAVADAIARMDGDVNARKRPASVRYAHVADAAHADLSDNAAHAIISTCPIRPLHNEWQRVFHACWFIERSGLQGDALNTCIRWIRTLAPVARWLRIMKGSHQPALVWFVHLAYSACVVGLGYVRPNDTTVAIAVGPHSKLLEDLRAYLSIFAACQGGGLYVQESVLWVLIGHYIVRPAINEHLAKILTHERCAPARDIVRSCLKRLVHLDGFPQAKHDKFQNGSFQSLAHTYCGTEVLMPTLRSSASWQPLVQIADAVVTSFRDGVSFSQLCKNIAACKAPGLTQPDKYWTVHFARIWLSEVSGICIPGTVTIDPLGLRYLYNMGEGAQALELAGCTEKMLPKLCLLVDSIAGTVGQKSFATHPASLVISACESHRRGGLATESQGFGHRPGL